MMSLLMASTRISDAHVTQRVKYYTYSASIFYLPGYYTILYQRRWPHTLVHLVLSMLRLVFALLWWAQPFAGRQRIVSIDDVVSL